MFLKTIKTKGITRLYFYESYYEPGPNKSERGQIRQRSVASLGILDDLKKEYEDPIAHFTELARQYNLKQRAKPRFSIDVDLNLAMSVEEDSIKNVGYGILKILYKQLDIDKFWKLKTKKGKTPNNLGSIFRTLVLTHTLFPGTKKQILENKQIFFRQIDEFSLADIYAALPYFSEYYEELQSWIFDHASKICDRNLSTAYLAFSNYKFNASEQTAQYPAKLFKMTILMDKNGLPLSYHLLDEDNTLNHQKNFTAELFDSELINSRVIFVADWGLNSPKHYSLTNRSKKSDGYFYAYALAKLSKEFKNWILEEEGYRIRQITDQNNHEIHYRYKSRIFSREISASRPNQIKRIEKQKQMVFYTEKLAAKQRIARNLMVTRAENIIHQPAQYNKFNTAGAETYIKNITFDQNTGDIIQAMDLFLDTDKIKDEEQYDGYYSIFTSELDMSDKIMGELYRALVHVEETFEISQSDFDLKPSSLTSSQYVHAHFSICYTSLVLVRLLQEKLENKYSVATVLSSLRKYSCIPVAANTFQFIYFDEVLRACEDAFELKLDYKYRSRLQIRRMLKY